MCVFMQRLLEQVGGGLERLLVACDPFCAGVGFKDWGPGKTESWEFGKNSLIAWWFSPN